MSTQTKAPEEIRKAVRERYGKFAEKAGADQAADCGCGTAENSSCCGGDASPEQLDTVARLYEDPDALTLPEEITNLSLGCGDPVTLAALKPGQTVLDLGSGGGIDCFLAAKKVGESGKIIGVDMTPSMIDRARENRLKVGAENVEFRLGEIEHLPVEDSSVDVIISNCVINLSTDKPQVFREAFRTLRPGGKLAVSDIVTDGPLPDAIKQNMSAWAGCVAGALDVNDYIAAIQDAGFEDVEVQASYWDEAIVDEAVRQLDPELQAQIEQAKLEGKGVMVLQEDIGETRVIEVDPEEADFDPQKAVFSARVTARKPE
jgi:arsenite methyltransferase